MLPGRYIRVALRCLFMHSLCIALDELPALVHTQFRNLSPQVHR